MAELHEGVYDALCVAFGAEGEEEIVDCGLGLSHFLAYACAAYVYVGVGGIESHGLFEVVVGHAEVLFLHGYACEAERGFGVAHVEAHEALVVGLGLGELAEVEFGAGLHGEHPLRRRVEFGRFFKVGESELTASGLCVDGRAQHVFAEQVIFFRRGRAFDGACHVVKRSPVFFEVVVVACAA